MAAAALDLDRRSPCTRTSTRWWRGSGSSSTRTATRTPTRGPRSGGPQTLRELRRRSIVFSGNLATNLVMEQTGVAACTAVMPQVRRMISDLPATDRGIVNAASARQWGAADPGARGRRGGDARPGIPERYPSRAARRHTNGQQDRLDRRPHPRHGDRAARRAVYRSRSSSSPASPAYRPRGQRTHRRGRRRGLGAPPVTTVERVDVERVSVPLHTPFVTALRRTTTTDTVVVRVTDSDGRTGWGEAPQVWQVTGGVAGRRRGLRRGAAARAVLGRTRRPAGRPGRWSTAPSRTTGAKAAVDVALHDLAGRRRGPPAGAAGRHRAACPPTTLGRGAARAAGWPTASPCSR